MISKFLQRLKNRRLSIRLAVLIIGCSILIALLASGIQLYFEYRRDIEAMYANLDFVEKSYLPAIATSSYLMDNEQLMIQLKGVLQIQGIEFLEVSEKRNNAPFRLVLGNPEVSQAITQEYELIYKKATDPEITVGTILIKASLAETYHRLRQRAIIILLTNGAGLLLVALSILMILEFTVARHLGKMTGYTDQLNIDKLDLELALNRKPGKIFRPDELDNLVNTINDLRIRLKQDIAARKQAQESLRQSEVNYRSIFNSVNDAIAIHDMATGEFLDVNKKYCELFAYTRDEVCKRTVEDMGPGEPPYTQADALERINRAAEGDPQLFEWMAKDSRGNLFWIEVNLKRATLEGQDRLLAVVRDITERKQAEEKLRRSEAKFRDLVENINDVIYSTDQNGEIVYISPSIKSVVGYDPSEIIGSNFTKYIHPDDLAYVTERFSRILSGELKPGEYRILAKSGEYHWIRASSKPLYEGNKILGLTGMFTDITEQKRLESELVQSRKIETVGTLAGGIAHDFNNILSAIIGYTELALSKAETNTKLYKDLQEVFHAGERAKDLVKQILLFSRQSEFERKPVLVKLVAKEALKFLRASLPTTIQISQSIRSESLVMADPTQMHQVLLNLCTNAEHAMQEKGGVLEVKLVDVDLDENFTADHPELNSGTHLELTVSDTGQGMPPHILERIFDPFFTTKEKGRGTGMGLAVVHGIVGSFGGKILVSSEPGQGSTFKIYLPVVKSRLEPVAETEETLSTGTERILFIDDETDLVNIGKRSLESLGYEVTTQTSSFEALELFKSKPEYFDLVITDMTMPHITGDILAVQLMKIRADIPVVICTGYSQKINDKKARKIGIKAFAYKPIVRKDLAKIVRKVLNEAKSSQST